MRPNRFILSFDAGLFYLVREPGGTIWELLANEGLEKYAVICCIRRQPIRPTSPVGGRVMTHATKITEFAAWSQNRGEARFTDWLRESARPTWDETINHRFTEELADGTLDPPGSGANDTGVRSKATRAELTFFNSA